MPASVLVAIIGCFAIAFTWVAIGFVRRKNQIHALQTQLAKLKDDLVTLEERFNKKCKQAEQIHSTLEKAREHVKKAKKRAFKRSRHPSQRPHPDPAHWQDDLPRLQA